MENIKVLYSDSLTHYKDKDYFVCLIEEIYKLLNHGRILLIIPDIMIHNISKLKNNSKVSINNFNELYNIVFDTMLIETKNGIGYKNKRIADDSLYYVKPNGLLYRFITNEKLEEIDKNSNYKFINLYEKIFKACKEKSLIEDFGSKKVLLNTGMTMLLTNIVPSIFKINHPTILDENQMFEIFQQNKNKYIDIIGKDDIETSMKLYSIAIKQKNLSKWCIDNNLYIDKIVELLFNMEDVDNITIYENQLEKISINAKKVSDYTYVDEKNNHYILDILSIPRINYNPPDDILILNLEGKIIKMYVPKINRTPRLKKNK